MNPFTEQRIDELLSILTHDCRKIREVLSDGEWDLRSPHVLMRPKVYPDGNQWCALYGDNLQHGVCGFGDTPEGACADFDYNWRNQKAECNT